MCFVDRFATQKKNPIQCALTLKVHGKRLGFFDLDRLSYKFGLIKTESQYGMTENTYFFFFPFGELR